jgi:hypothetical protein
MRTLYVPERMRCGDGVRKARTVELLRAKSMVHAAEACVFPSWT